MTGAFLVAIASTTFYRRIRMKRLIALVVMAGGLHAETVFMSAHGKTFHKSQQCMSLRRSTHVYSADDADAKAHGLHACSICFREHKAGGSTGASSWARETKKAEVK
jgi:hypothetical protein